ncbi:hypothetical protein S101395_02726 [Bacillus sonorensis]|uniref:Uncharacterized protein n=1 Tax=Bacillus sonorensis TaxID=119858 RepID=A0ABN5AEM1_9BACI|nr:hypothetical protein S101395_02726 [Bacillus sonorensis]GIN68447.1 hypothetical protein J41TS2_38680 [Bacillus sonorensis]
MSRRIECPENYKVTTEITEEAQEWIKEVMRSKKFYDFAVSLMYKYKKI